MMKDDTVRYKGKIYEFTLNASQEEKDEYNRKRKRLSTKNLLRNRIKKQIHEIISFHKYGEEPSGNLLILKKRIENQFTKEMHWFNYAVFWETDHIKPLNNFESLEEMMVKGNQLSNLQPVPISFNRKKKDSNIVFNNRKNGY